MLCNTWTPATLFSCLNFQTLAAQFFWSICFPIICTSLRKSESTPWKVSSCDYWRPKVSKKSIQFDVAIWKNQTQNGAKSWNLQLWFKGCLFENHEGKKLQYLFKLQKRFVQIIKYIFFNLQSVFVKISKCVCPCIHHACWHADYELQYLFKLQNVCVQIAKCICSNCKVYLFRL